MIQSPGVDPTSSCFAHLEGAVLAIGNAVIERRWLLCDGLLLPIALVDRASGRSWLLPGTQPGAVPPAAPPAFDRPPRLQLRRGRASPVEGPSLVAELVCGEGETRIAWSFQIFPASAVITCRLLSWPAGATSAAASAPAASSGIESDAPAAAGDGGRGGSDLCERLLLACHHAHVHGVELADRTDGHDNLASPYEHRIAAPEPLRLRGNVFAIEDPLSGDGLILLKHAPLPHARPVPCAVDLRTWHDGAAIPQRPALALHGHGAVAGTPGYAWSVGCYRGGTAGRIAALHDLQRCFRAYLPERDGMLLSNTWGDRNRDGRICAAFMAQEIAAGARLGIDVVQIDDGWQRGISSNSVNRKRGGVWQGFWAADAAFWEPHPERFPDGLASTTTAAASHGLAFGLWFAPDSIDDFRHWRRDAEAVLGLWRRYGVTQVKIDGVKAHSPLGEANLQRFFAAVLDGSDGAITFDLDVTAEVRPGYFGALGVGPLFVENRYTDSHRWWPHATLRNLWQLAHWIDPVRLRMEFLNRQRHAALYAGDPLAPMAYTADWLFASVMIASPLAWFEVSELPDADAAGLIPLIAVWKQHRTALHGGAILPLGRCPDGASCSGFLSQAADGRSAYLIALREPLAPSTTLWQLPLMGDWRVEVLAGAGWMVIERGVVSITWDTAPGYVFARLTAQSQ